MLLIPIILENYVFWINFIVIVGIGTYLLLTNKEYILKELSIQLLGTFIILLIAYSFIYQFTIDLIQKEYLGGKIIEATYEEPWTEEYDCSYQECTGSGKSQSCRTIHKICTRRHFAEYYIKTSNNTLLTINENQWNTYKNEFKATENKKFRSSQTMTSKMLGEGDIWTSFPNKVIPSAEEHGYINYIKASTRNLYKKSSGELSIDDNKSIYSYPKLENTKYGTIHLNRVIGNVINKNELQNELDMLSVKYAKLKEINILLYFIENKDLSFAKKIEGQFPIQKNDATIILNSVDGVITWGWGLNFLGGAEFKVQSEHIFNGIKLENTKEIIEKYEELISKYWKRETMKNYEYLKADVEIDLKWHLLIILINTLFNIFVFKYFKNNDNFN